MPGLMDIIAGAVSGLGDTAVKIRTAITGIDPAKQAELTQLAAQIDAAKAKAETDLMQAQIEANKQEASNQNLFVSGWRPFIGWICGIAIGYNFLVIPFGSLILKLARVDFAMPSLDMAQLWTLVTGMLGLGTMRTVEKLQGAQGNH